MTSFFNLNKMRVNGIWNRKEWAESFMGISISELEALFENY